MTIVIPLAPITKKNSQQILINRKTGRPFISPSKQYKQYKKDCEPYLEGLVEEPIDQEMAVKCVYYTKTRRKVDLTNLMEATHDILQDAGVISDDALIKSVDGSRVYHDKDNPRTEIEITILS